MVFTLNLINTYQNDLYIRRETSVDAEHETLGFPPGIYAMREFINTLGTSSPGKKDLITNDITRKRVYTELRLVVKTQ